MRSEYPSVLSLGPEIWRSPVRFPAPRRSVWGNLFVNVGMSWDVSGSGLGTLLDGFGMVSHKNVGRGQKLKFSKMARSILPESGCLKISFLLIPGRKSQKYSFLCRGRRHGWSPLINSRTPD